MKRIYPAHAYGPAPRARCYWPATSEPPDLPVATGQIKTDVAIIGAGFTGLSAAVHLTDAGADVTVLEAETPGWGASGRNGGFCCLGGSAASAAMLRRSYGEAARLEFCQAELQSVHLVRDLITDHAIDADTHSKGETLLAHTKKAMRGFEGRIAALEADFGVSPTLITESELTQHGLGGPFFGAMTTPVGFALNPYKYVLGLARAAGQAGARVFQNSPVQGIERTGQGYTLTTQGAQITCKRLIVATNGYSSDDLPGWMAGRYLPTQSNVIVSRPLTDDEIAAQGWSSHQMCYDDRFFLHYFRLMPNKRMLFGMRGGLRCSPAGDAGMHRTIRRHFDRMFPAWAHVETPFSWNGMLSISQDLTPYTGPIPGMPGAFVSMSYHGNGVAMASYAGALLADQVLDRAATQLHPAIMKRPPKRMPLGPLRRSLLWPPYTLAMLRDE